MYKLSHTSIGVQLSYEALSYTWGSAVSQIPISVNGSPFMVNNDLYAALIELRGRDRERVVWIDAILTNEVLTYQ